MRTVSHSQVILKHILSLGDFTQLYRCIVSDEAILWQQVWITLIHRILGLSVLRIFVDMLLISLDYHVFSKEYAVIALASTLTWNILFEICPSVGHKETDL
jgi:hypothetical protein